VAHEAEESDHEEGYERQPRRKNSDSLDVHPLAIDRCRFGQYPIEHGHNYAREYRGPEHDFTAHWQKPKKKAEEDAVIHTDEFGRVLNPAARPLHAVPLEGAVEVKSTGRRTRFHPDDQVAYTSNKVASHGANVHGGIDPEALVDERGDKVLIAKPAGRRLAGGY
jgi:hypothetical protein